MSLEGPWTIKGTEGKVSPEFYAHVQEAVANAPRCDLCHENPVSIQAQAHNNKTGEVLKTSHLCVDCFNKIPLKDGT